MTKEDESLIYSTWLLGLRHGNDWFLSIDKDLFFQRYKKIIEAILAVANVRIACLNDDPDVIIGYSVSRGKYLDWVFVKRSWRRLGVSKILIPPDITTVTHLTRMFKSIKKPEWTFDPFFTL